MASSVPEIRVAVIGAGMAGQSHAHAYRNIESLFHPLGATIRLTVLADANEALAQTIAKKYGFERVARSWQEVAEANDVDAVSVVLPNFEHRIAVEALLASGKHVLCEKPLGRTARESWELLQAAKKAGVVHACGFNLRRTPAIAAIKQSLDRGDYGDVRQFIGRYLTDYAASVEAAFTWRYQLEQAGGGAIIDIGPHIIDTSRFLLGDIERVQGAAMQTFIKERPIASGQVIGHGKVASSGEFGPVDTDDAASFAVTFKSGAIGEFTVNRSATGFRNSVGFTLVGTQGSAAFDFERTAEFEYFDGRQEDSDYNGFRRVIAGPSHPYLKNVLIMPVAGVGYGISETFFGQTYEFIRAVIAGRPLETAGFEDGYAASLVCEAVQRSAEQGRSVSIRELAEQTEAATG